MSFLVTEKRQGVAILTLNDPTRRNILSGVLCQEIIEAVDAANSDPDVNALIVTGAGSAFCGGADLDDLQAAARGDYDAVQTVYRSFMAVANSPLPTIAAVNGPAVGAGMNLALACDMRIASTNALFDTRFLKIGLHPGGGHSWLLLRAVGWAQASRMLLGGHSMRGEEALSNGLVQQLAQAAQLIDGAIDMARPIAAVPRELLLRAKASMRLAAMSSHADTFAHETAEQAWSLGEPAFTELVTRLQLSLGADGK